MGPGEFLLRFFSAQKGQESVLCVRHIVLLFSSHHSFQITNENASGLGNLNNVVHYVTIILLLSGSDKFCSKHE